MTDVQPGTIIVLQERGRILGRDDADNYDENDPSRYASGDWVLIERLRNGERFWLPSTCLKREQVNRHD